MALAECLQLPRHVAVAAQGQVCLDAGLDGRHRQLLQPRPLAQCELRVRELHQRLVTAQRQRGVQGPRRHRSITADELTTALRDKTLEADDVEILRRDAEARSPHQT